MKHLLIIILTISIFQTSIGQVATIQDPDGWTNIRLKPSIQSEVIHKVYESEVFWYDYEDEDDGQEWIRVYLPKNDYSLGKSESDWIAGYIHNSRLLPLEKLNSYHWRRIYFPIRLKGF